MKPTRALLQLALAAFLFAPACGDDPPAAPSPSPPTSLVQIFTGTLSAKGTAFFSFGSDPGTASVTLVGLSDSTGAPLSLPVTLGFGIPQGTGCGTTATAAATPGLAAQIKGTTPASSIYCVSISDTFSSITADVDFTIRLVYPIAETPAGTAGTETFASSLTVGGSATRTFPATAAGVASLTLQGVSPSATLGLAIGIPYQDGRGCNVMRAVNTGPGSGAQITAPVDSGTYCVRVYDIGQLTTTSTFSIAIAHP